MATSILKLHENRKTHKLQGTNVGVLAIWRCWLPGQKTGNEEKRTGSLRNDIERNEKDKDERINEWEKWTNSGKVFGIEHDFLQFLWKGISAPLWDICAPCHVCFYDPLFFLQGTANFSNFTLINRPLATECNARFGH